MLRSRTTKIFQMHVLAAIGTNYIALIISLSRRKQVEEWVHHLTSKILT